MGDDNTKPPFRKQLASLINWNSKENGSNTPDFILAKFLEAALAAFDESVRDRDAWYDPQIRQQQPAPLQYDEHGPAAPGAETDEQRRARWANEMRDGM